MTKRKDEDFTFITRYEALGIPFPDPDTVCKGECQGTGYVPISEHDMEEPWRELWLEAERIHPADDGWHFVQCPACKGSGLRPKN